MKPKEKAEQLIKEFEVFYDANGGNCLDKEDRRFAAIICIDEIINSQNGGCMECGGGDKEYWEQVKKEIQNL